MNDTEGRGQSKGRANQANEDAFEANDNLGLYVVCDGAGDEEGGEIASHLAVEAIRRFVDRTVTRGRRFRSRAFSTATAVEAIDTAFDTIFQESRRSPALARMTTTVTMLLLTADRAVVGHVGDSRLYLATGDELQLLTVDHPTTKEASGVTVVGVDAFSFATRPGDVFLLCSDGVRGALEDERWVMSVLRAGTISSAAQRLLDRAAAIEPDVDATVVLVRIAEEMSPVAVRHTSSSPHAVFADFGFAGLPTGG